MQSASSISEQNLFEYLTQKLEYEISQVSISITDDTVCYLGRLLDYFAASDNFYLREHNKHSLPTLALLYKDARETQSNSNKNKLLRKLGDSALFMGAWFSELYHRKGIQQDYFIGMGSAAYDYLAVYDEHQSSTYAELSNHLPQLITVSARVLSKSGELSAQDIFALYRKWLNKKDPRLQAQLQAAGVQVVDSKLVQ